MSIFHNISAWWHDLFRRRRLSLFNTRNNREVWYTHISPINIFMASVATLCFISILILTLVGYTSILDLLPGYRSEATKSRATIVKSIHKLDSMELVINSMMLYNENIALIMENKLPNIFDNNSLNREELVKRLALPNSADSVLRARMEGNTRYNHNTASVVNEMPMVSPADGIVIERFDPAHANLGVKITTSAENRVISARRGVVSMVIWSPDSDNTIQIIHPNNLITIYRNIKTSMVRRGESVKAGEVIGEINPEKALEFELWEEGKPINPERYITF